MAKKGKAKTLPRKKSASAGKKRATAKVTKTTSAASDDFRPQILEDVLYRNNQDGTIAVMRLSEETFFYQIDHLAAQVWNAIDGKKTLGQIKQRLRKQLNVRDPRFDTDVRKFIADLQRKGFIR